MSALAFRNPTSELYTIHPTKPPKKSTSKVSSQSQRRQLKSNLHYLTIEKLLSKSDTTIGTAISRNGGGRSNKIQHPKKKNLENLTLKPKSKS
jgi:hypothetical protein